MAQEGKFSPCESPPERAPSPHAQAFLSQALSALKDDASWVEMRPDRVAPKLEKLGLSDSEDSALYWEAGHVENWDEAKQYYRRLSSTEVAPELLTPVIRYFAYNVAGLVACSNRVAGFVARTSLDPTYAELLAALDAGAPMPRRRAPSPASHILFLSEAQSALGAPDSWAWMWPVRVEAELKERGLENSEAAALYRQAGAVKSWEGAKVYYARLRDGKVGVPSDLYTSTIRWFAHTVAGLVARDWPGCQIPRHSELLSALAADAPMPSGWHVPRGWRPVSPVACLLAEAGDDPRFEPPAHA